MNKSPKKSGLAVLFFVFILVFGWAGCSKTGSSLTINPVSYLSVINEATYSGAVNVYLNDTIATQQPISAGTFSPQYGTIRPGNYAVKFVGATVDTTLGQVAQSLFDTLNFYTLVLYNPPAAGSAAQAMKIWDDFSSISTANANYRFFNLCADYPSVDLYFNNTLVQPGRTTADNAGNQSLNSFLAVPPGNYTMTVKMAGTDSVVATINAGMLQGDVYTVFLGGNTKSRTTPVQINLLQASY